MGKRISFWDALRRAGYVYCPECFEYKAPDHTAHQRPEAFRIKGSIWNGTLIPEN